MGDGLTFRGLRRTTATMLDEAGCDTDDQGDYESQDRGCFGSISKRPRRRSGQRRRLPNSIS
jgi:hypothetical protein